MTYRIRQRGQSLIVAVIVLFVMLFIGGVFVGLVARNMLNTGHAKDTVTAQQFAEAGIKAVQFNLLNSLEGADWRPAPTPPINANDPDKQWLDVGYSRIEFGRTGRSLVRVSYTPGLVTDPKDPTKVILDPNGKYIKAESIGRVGFLDQNDPTTFLNSPAPRLRREYIAYVPIGITDFLRYVTNKTNDSKAEAIIGVPSVGVPLAMQLGKLLVRTFGSGPQPFISTGAPMMINSEVTFIGQTDVQVDRRLSESVFVAGRIKTEGGATYTDPENGGTATIKASDDPTGFTSFVGRIRDNSPNPDDKGYALSIPRLDPPLIDLADLSGSTRYRLLTRESGRILGTGANAFNTGRFSLGAGIYINNFGNYEQETRNVSGGQSLRSIWLRPGSNGRWNGPHYIPPGATVLFGYPIAQDRDPMTGKYITGSFSPHAGFTVIRDGVSGDRGFQDPNDPTGRRYVLNMNFTFFIYKPVGRKPVVKLDNDLFRQYLIGSGVAADDAAVDSFLPEFNGVIFAEGNIRTRGLLAAKTVIPVIREADEKGTQDPDADPSNPPVISDPKQIRDIATMPAITLVSDASIYVEGSLVRESYTRQSYGGAQMPGAMIGLLAKEYVAVNSTMFMAENKSMPWAATDLNELAPFHTDIGLGEPVQTPPFALDFIFGDNPATYTQGHRDGDPKNPGPPAINLLLRHAAPGATADPTYLNLYVNPAFEVAQGDSLYLFNANPGPYDLANPPPNVDVLVDGATQRAPVFEQREFVLLPIPNGSLYKLFTAAGFQNQIRPAVDPNFTSSAGTQDYLLSRAAVVPMDVRIEAVMYAQNGSFFIIPGYSLNTNPADTRDAALRRAQSLGLAVGTMVRPAGTSDYYPFYNEPMDVRITIVGAIAENRTASYADQAAWMQMWGWIPEVQGSTGRQPPVVDKTREIMVPDEHLRLADTGTTLPGTDPRTAGEKNGVNIAGQTFGITRGIRYIYDPALPVPYPGYTPAAPAPDVVKTNWSWQSTGALRQDDYGRFLPPIPRLPVSPTFAFYGEVR